MQIVLDEMPTSSKLLRIPNLYVVQERHPILKFCNLEVYDVRGVRHVSFYTSLGLLAKTHLTCMSGCNVAKLRYSDNQKCINLVARFIVLEETKTVFIVRVSGFIFRTLSNYRWFDLQELVTNTELDPDISITWELLHSMNHLFKGEFHVKLYNQTDFDLMKQEYAERLCASGCTLPFHISVLQHVAWFMRPWWFDFDYDDKALNLKQICFDVIYG